MKKTIYFLWIFLFILFYGNSNCQTAIENDNIYGLGFFTPDREIKEKKIQMVKKYILTQNKKKILVEESHYDLKGYLIYKKNIDPNNINDLEIITIKNTNYENFDLVRHVQKESLLRAGDNPYTFWGLYYPLLKYNESKLTNILKVESKYKWMKDSSLMYSTYLNGEKIDSGFSIKLNTLAFTNSIQSKDIHFTIDSVILNDTLIIKNLKGLSDSTYNSVNDFFYGGRLMKTENIILLRGIVWFKTCTIYKYNLEGRRIFEGYYNNQGKLSGNKIFKYVNGSSKYTIDKEVFDDSGKIKSVTKYDTEGRVIEETQIRWAGKLIDEKIINKYFENGLLEEKQVWNNGEFVTKYFFEYKRFGGDEVMGQ